MASSVYYKFKSQKDESKIIFDGTGISVFDLKKEIIIANNLKANDFDLLVFDPSTDQEYRDDAYIIPRSSSIVVKRVPGKGKVALYLSGATPIASSDGSGSGTGSSTLKGRLGQGSLSKRFDGVKDEDTKSGQLNSTVMTSASGSDEAAAVAAMFKAQTDVWEETQEKMSQAVPIYNNTRGTARGGKTFVSRQMHPQSDRPLPPSYVCYRCGQKGHWIHDCPTNNDREYDNRPRIKRTTGIPRSFLKAVDSPSEGKLTQGVMVTPDGGYVVAQPDLASWQKQVTRAKGAVLSDIREKTPSDPSLVCPLDKKLFLEAVKTPCCGTAYCEDCIHSYLLENDFVCPKCSKKVTSLENLLIDKPTRTRVGDYIDKLMKENTEAEEAALKALEASEQEEGDESAEKDDNDAEHFDEQPGNNYDFTQIHGEISRLQGQISQLSDMLQNPSLPLHVRRATMEQHQQYQMQLQQLQTFAALADMNAVATQQAMGNIEQMLAQAQAQAQWTAPAPFPNQQPPAGQDSAYQRLPLNNRRRTNKRERPSDFLEIGSGETQSKMPKFWE